MLAFAQEESAGTQLSVENWVDEYIYSYIHKEFFIWFPIILYEWLTRLATRQTNFQIREAVEWSDQLVHEVTSISNAISRAVDFWVDNILQGYIIGFVVDTITSYSEDERNFFQGPRRRYLLRISTWIKMLSYEKGILQLSSWVACLRRRICNRRPIKNMGKGELKCSMKAHNLN